jgi:hypothetical protein
MDDDEQQAVDAWLSDWAWHEAMAKEHEEELQEVDRA